MRPARDSKAGCPAVPASGAHRSLSATAVASPHDTAAATKRRPRPALRSAHRSPGPRTRGGGSCQGLGMEEKAAGTRGERRAGRGGPKCARSPGATSSASSSAVRPQGKQFAFVLQPRLSPAAPPNDGSEPSGVSSSLCKPPNAAGSPPARPPQPAPGPGTRPAPGNGACSSRAVPPEGSPGGGTPRSSWLRHCGRGRLGRCCRSQRSPWSRAGVAGAPGARGSPAAGVGGCFCPAPHPPPPPRLGAHLPPTPHVRCGSRAAGQRKEAAPEALGVLSTCPAARPPGLGEAAAAAIGASQRSPPTAAAENQGGERGAREQRDNCP